MAAETSFWGHGMVKSPQISQIFEDQKSAANQRERSESNLIRVRSRKFAAKFGSSYLRPSEGITGHVLIVIIAVLTGATSCVESIKRSQELRRMEEEERGRRHV